MNMESHNHEIPPAIRRARFDQLTIYEISEDELITLEKGSPDSVYLSISIAFLSSAISCSVAVPSIHIGSQKLLFAFISFIILGYIVGGVLMILWLKSKSSVSTCVKKIRNRLPPEGSLLPCTDDNQE
ncbi:hypothetical protein [Shewanella sp.]|uniref:hypothetical protein n=1 Tax=Shewanella sp. TaxID=50422 RepID=UPI004053DA3E